MPNITLVSKNKNNPARTTLDVLEGAKTVIATRGWGRQQYLSKTSGAVCAMGAVYIASGILDPTTGYMDHSNMGGTLSYGAYGLLSRALPNAGGSVVDWNDADATSPEDVQALFDRAIELYREENPE